MSKHTFVRFGSAAIVAVLAVTLTLVVRRSSAQQTGARINRSIDNSQRFTIVGSRPRRIGAATDAGRMNSGARLQGVSLEFSRSAAQEAALRNLIAEQQNPASPLYHKWLTPDEFAARFGLAETDLAKVKGWLQQQGFTIDNVSRSRTRISFSGTVRQVEGAFGTEMHSFHVGSETHFAPSTDITIPAALSSVVQGVSRLSNFRPQARLKPRPDFTSSQTGNHFLTPKDVATIYDINNPDINPAFTAGYNGTGQSIAVVGQSAVSLLDIENFQSAAGLNIKDPILVLVPSSGASKFSAGDESESDLDLEYSGGIATGATIYFVYVGADTTTSVWNSIQYAVDTDIAPIISTSYGICETALTSNDYTILESIFSQAASQGQTVIGPSGDTGSTDCSGVSGLNTAQQQALAVDYPASSAYVTAMGGTEFSSADTSSSNTTYWQSANGTDVIGSAKSYISEQVWNDDSSSGLSSGGGGVSALTGHQSWQSVSVPGIASATGNRMVPDISLSASSNNAGYLFCSSDSSFTKVTGSCSKGFRDSNGASLTVAGGTSFDAPIFAGLVALINQKENSTGLGLINPTLYNLSTTPATYASAFHDITSGNNECTAGTTLCSGAGTTNYAAGTGYDKASGLGSIDFNNLLSAWTPSGTSTLQPSLTTLSAASTMPAVGAADAITITVASNSSSSTTTPTGTLTMNVDGSAVSSPPALSNGTAIFDFAPSSTGSHVITATYSGDGTYAPSTGTVVVGSGSFRLSATSVSVSDGSTGTSSITITPQNSYAGTIQWAISSSPNILNSCFSLPNATVSGSTTTASLTIHTSSSGCSGASLIPNEGLSGGGTQMASVSDGSSSSQSSRHRSGLFSLSSIFSFSMGLLIAGVFAFRSRKPHAVVGVFALAAITVAGVGCGGSSTPKAAKGTYTLTVTGTDTASSTIAASTTLSLTVN